MRIDHHTPAITSQTTATLMVGDVAAIVAFAALGIRSHASSGGALYVLETAAPFVVSWLAIAPFIGAYRGELLANPRVLVGRTLLAWAAALFPGIVLRTLIRQSAFPAISFAITTFLIIGVLLLGWRLLFAWLLRRGARHAN